ncbi:hypothetical protein GGX14DRAFT_400924 [Mycena pura]|uniref:Uncharacterized protein n=1 Tax=Mycena pura TaxID=153505 RepID=A0AAD6V3Q1_9AGAR|nr:hypothetical protein GGX14DRAFT_400924 [Mycena pura]
MMGLRQSRVDVTSHISPARIAFDSGKARARVAFVTGKACVCITFVKGEPRAPIVFDSGEAHPPAIFDPGEARLYVAAVKGESHICVPFDTSKARPPVARENSEGRPPVALENSEGHPPMAFVSDQARPLVTSIKGEPRTCVTFDNCDTHLPVAFDTGRVQPYITLVKGEGRPPIAFKNSEGRPPITFVKGQAHLLITCIKGKPRTCIAFDNGDAHPPVAFDTSRARVYVAFVKDKSNGCWFSKHPSLCFPFYWNVKSLNKSCAAIISLTSTRIGDATSLANGLLPICAEPPWTRQSHFQRKFSSNSRYTSTLQSVWPPTWKRYLGTRAKNSGKWGAWDEVKSGEGLGPGKAGSWGIARGPVGRDERGVVYLSIYMLCSLLGHTFTVTPVLHFFAKTLQNIWERSWDTFSQIITQKELRQNLPKYMESLEGRFSLLSLLCKLADLFTTCKICPTGIT